MILVAHAPYSVAPGLFRAIVNAKRRGPLSVHVGESAEEIEFLQTGRGPFRALLQDGTRMPDPSLLVSIPSLAQPDMAPVGKHTLYVLEPVPNLDGRVDWAPFGRPFG